VKTKRSSKLDSIETTGTSRPPESYRNFCIDHCSDEYQASLDAYREFDLGDYKDRVHTLEQCRTRAWFARNVKTHMVKVISSSCHLRWCPMCSATRRWFLTQQVSDWLTGVAQPKFLTLTVQHSSYLLDDQIRFLYDSFRKYRKLNLLKRNVRGGVWFFQIHRSKHDGLWHPHLHCVIDSPWLDKYELSTAWELVTKTSKIINIKEVKDADSMAEYVARYAARPSLLSSLDVPGRLELLQALHGKRLVGTWGSARSISLRPSKPADAGDWSHLGSFSTVMLFLGQDSRADAIWNAFKTNTECPDDCDLQDVENFLDNVQADEPRAVIENYQMLLDFY